MTGAPGNQRPIGFKPAEISALINRDVVQQHCEEAAFLWTQRDSAATAPNYSLADLAKLDLRVEAHLDGLRGSGDIGWGLALAAQEMGPGEAFAAAVLAFESRDSTRIDAVLGAVASDPVLQRGVISALGWMQTNEALTSAAPLLTVDSPAIQRIALAAFAIHRRDAEKALTLSLDSEHDRLRARALKAVGELARADLSSHLAAHFNDTNGEARMLAAWSSARLRANLPQAIRVLVAAAEECGPQSVRAADMAARVMLPEDAAIWQQTLSGTPTTKRLAVIVAGIVGDPFVVPWLTDVMQQPDLARIAGDSFSLITGADLGYEDLDADAPEDFAEADADADGDETIDPDEDLQWPAVQQISDWWSKRGHQFRAGIRYLRGEPITPESLARTLALGTQRQRAAAALELAIRNPSEPLFEVRERGDRQLLRVRQCSS